MKIIIICLIVSSFLWGQSRNPFYVSTELQTGLPKEIPFKWQNTCYAKINSGEFYKALFVVSKDSFKTPDESFLFVVKKEGFTFSRLSFINNEAVTNLTTEEEDLLAPLKIIPDVEKGKILYSWGSNADESANPYVTKKYELKPGRKFQLISIESRNGLWTNKDKHKIIVINWWSTGCVPCVEEIPGLNELVKKYDRNSIEFIAIVHDKENHSKFISKHNFIYEQCFGDKNITALFGESFPRHLIIDKDGIIVYNKLGGSKNTYLELERVLDTMR